MFKKTSDYSRFRLRPKDSYSSEDARRWVFYASVLYEIRSKFDSYRQGRLRRVWAEIERDGELDHELPWLRDIFIPWLGPTWRSTLENKFILATMNDSEK